MYDKGVTTVSSKRMMSRSAWAGALLIASAAPWAAVLVVPGGSFSQQQHRRTTDPPIPAKGKLGQELFLAIDHRNQQEIEGLLKQGADANARNGLEFTPLYVAAASHQPEAMKALIAASAAVDADSPYGTALTFASATGHTEGVKMLLERGADVNVARVDGLTPLMMAANAGNPTTVAELISHKADVNLTNMREASALHYAARAGHIPVGEMLLKAGAKVDVPDEDKQTPLMAAAKAGQAAFVKLLLENGAKPNAKDEDGRTALVLSASYGDYPEVLRALIANGANPRAADAKGRSAGSIAAARGYAETAKVLGATAAVPAMPTRSAIAASLKLLEKSMTAFSDGTACISCHQEGLGRMTTASARERGFKIDQALLKAQNERIRGALGALKPLHQGALQNPHVMNQVPLIEINEVNTGYGWLVGGMAAQGDTATEATAAIASVMARQQRPDGMWSFSLPRAPMQSSPFTTTALAVRAIQTYAPRAAAIENAERLANAKAWLSNAPAKSSDDLTFRLLGLKWAGASADERRTAADELLAAQNPDGGWSQLPGMPSDAYATGQAVYALSVAGGMTPPAKGIEYLLRTQDDDGSWFVNKRAIPANNFFDAAFPHGESQYASFNGTCWATLALLETLPKK